MIRLPVAGLLHSPWAARSRIQTWRHRLQAWARPFAMGLRRRRLRLRRHEILAQVEAGSGFRGPIPATERALSNELDRIDDKLDSIDRGATR